MSGADTDPTSVVFLRLLFHSRPTAPTSSWHTH